MADRIAPLLAFFCLALYLVAASFGMFIGGLWATLGIGGALILFTGTALHDRRMPSLPRGLVFFVFAVLGFFALELPFSSHVAVSLHLWTQLASIFLPLLLLTAPRVQSLALAPDFSTRIAIAACIGAFALQLELQSGGYLLHLHKPGASLTEYNRGIAHMAILAFPIFAGLWQAGKKEETCLLALAFFFPAGLTESHTAKLAFMAGAVCTIAASYRPLWVRNALALLALVLMGWPFYARWFFSGAYETVELLPPSWRHRVGIWDYLSYRIQEHPWFGWGLGTTHLLDFIHPHGYLYDDVARAAPHAHNFVVEIWVETGLAGLGFGLAFLLIMLRGAYRLHPKLRPFAMGSWLAAVTVGLFGFDLWTDALWSAFALSAFAFGMLQQKLEREHHLVDA